MADLHLEHLRDLILYLGEARRELWKANEEWIQAGNPLSGDVFERWEKAQLEHDKAHRLIVDAADYEASK